MSDSLQSIASWAASLDVADIPKDVLIRAQLQHLSTAGNLRAVLDWPKINEHRSAAAKYAAQSAQVDYTDHIFWGQTSFGAVFPTLESPKGRSALKSLVATVVANEVAGRFGAATCLSSPSSLQSAQVHCLSAAASTAKILDLSAAHTALAYQQALENSPSPSTKISKTTAGARAQLIGECIDIGIEAAHFAASATPPHSATLLLPEDAIEAAFSGFGTCWLGRTTAFSLYPGHLFSQVPVQATMEILRRHIKAADKRLRIDQIDRIEVRTNALTLGLAQSQTGNEPIDPAAVCADFRRQIGVLFVNHELNSTSLHPDELTKHSEAIDWVAERVDLIHDWPSTLSLIHAMREGMAPLFGQLTLKDLWSHSRSHHQENGWNLGFPPSEQWKAILQGRPDRLFKAQHHAVDLADIDERSFRYCLPTEVKLFTTRGGWWPERRTTPEGAPGWNWKDTVDGVAAKFGGSNEEDTLHAQSLLKALPDKSTTTWKKALRLR